MAIKLTISIKKFDRTVTAGAADIYRRDDPGDDLSTPPPPFGFSPPMCKRAVIVPGMLVTGLMYLAVSALLFLLASSAAGNDEATLAFNGANISQAVWLVLVAIIMCPLGFIGPYAAREHNKFCLGLFFLITLTILFIMWGVVGSMSAFSNLPEDDQGVLKCLTYEREDDPFDENEWIAEWPEHRTPTCQRIFEDAFMIRLRGLWVHLHDIALNDKLVDSKKWNTFMAKLQSGEVGGGACCGFSRPGFCTGHAMDECFEDAVVKNKGETYYIKNTICNQGKGGCIFDKPLGICACELMHMSSICFFGKCPLTQQEGQGPGPGSQARLAQEWSGSLLL